MEDSGGEIWMGTIGGGVFTGMMEIRSQNIQAGRV